MPTETDLMKARLAWIAALLDKFAGSHPTTAEFQADVRAIKHEIDAMRNSLDHGREEN